MDIACEGDRAKLEEFMKMLQGRKGERHAVVMQDFPDPDALSCAWAYRQIVAGMGIETDLIYGGRISHQENIALTNLLKIEVLAIPTDQSIDKQRYQGSVFVDNQGTTSNLVDRLEKNGVPVLAIIDHHAPQDRLKPLFMDIRPIGACASILTDYIYLGALNLVASNLKHKYLATALMHGIISETASMIRALPMDFFAAARLQPFYDNDLLVDILHQQRSHRGMEIIRLALENREIREGVCLSGVGYLRASDRDSIPQAADFLLTEETVHTAIVFGIVTHSNGEEVISGSLRTTKSALNPDAFIKEGLGRAASGTFYGGGKASAGGFEIPLGFLSGSEDEDLAKMKWDTFNAKIRKKFFGSIGADNP
ncbi:MAG: bifunctional oligoribonuclease/PAP phosphatase NrnA [Magnetococcales bacterium]|nr:bifunctional oligoribonuclease/PAP phosphatase NrnA [Magnetococcales bacterium]MBF0151216.1 bifunctional oligoribonuclease/PAP phosphatase NrnA [Magnetococcales bacterium]MBF0173071.1 bifunctional oligoribonuclease/PAP phosphatase NrnA [Magnetococcales bacterium]MBF0347243.1 bifunctional oligoribonuclease/PAP phosphatase NrnA [Magnetococcales bacterium]MBF0630152.1 bifunctional oligoribonuclease/PAP phosphatase NrnA [Magnetococcales bacterium]